VLTIPQALADLGLTESIDVLPVLSGYPSPKYINLVLRRLGGRTYLFESSATRDDIVADVTTRLDDLGVDRLDALLLTHCHGDHAGGAGLLAGRGRAEGERAPIYVHSAGYRFLTQPEPMFLNETYELFLARAQWGLMEYHRLSESEILENELRRRFENYFSQTPKSALRFVDHGQLPEGIAAVFTPGHSHDCCLYYDDVLEIAVPGDTIITTGTPDDPGTHAYVIPIFTVAGQIYSMAYERFCRTIRVLRRFFETHRVRAIIPPHGRLAVTDPLGWCDFAVGYFEGIYAALIDDFFGDESADWKSRPFLARDLARYIPSAGAHPISTASHTFGMLCMLADEGYLTMTEDTRSRQLSFELAEMPPTDFVANLLAADAGHFSVYRNVTWDDRRP
jgi:glyoxylase-like metal-dependent hydrolase (beta-lactamase superfamily II)